MEPSQRSGACPGLTLSNGARPARHMRSGQGRGTPPLAFRPGRPSRSGKKGGRSGRTRKRTAFPCPRATLPPRPVPPAQRRASDRPGGGEAAAGGGADAQGFDPPAGLWHAQRKAARTASRVNALRGRPCWRRDAPCMGHDCWRRVRRPRQSHLSSPRRDTAAQAERRDGSLPPAFDADRDGKGLQSNSMKTAPASTFTGNVCRLTQAGNRLASPVR